MLFLFVLDKVIFSKKSNVTFQRQIKNFINYVHLRIVVYFLQFYITDICWLNFNIFRMTESAKQALFHACFNYMQNKIIQQILRRKNLPKLNWISTLFQTIIRKKGVSKESKKYHLEFQMIFLIIDIILRISLCVCTKGSR